MRMGAVHTGGVCWEVEQPVQRSQGTVGRREQEMVEDRMWRDHSGHRQGLRRGARRGSKEAVR